MLGTASHTDKKDLANCASSKVQNNTKDYEGGSTLLGSSFCGNANMLCYVSAFEMHFALYHAS
jgi:hypothetical protein